MNKDSVQFLTDKYSELTSREKKLVDYMIIHINDVLSMSVAQLSKESGVSVATVVRLAQHMGFDGYKEFRLHLAKCSNGHEDFVLDLKSNDKSVAGQVHKMLSSCSESLRLTAENVDVKLLSTIAKAMKSSQNIFFFGNGTSYIVCEDSAIKFKRIGKNAACSCDLHSASLTLANFKKGDIVFGISHSGQNSSVIKVLELSRKLGFTTVALTTFPESGIYKSADYVLHTQTRESPLHKIAITSRVSQFAMMDSLFMAYLTADYDACMKNIEKLSELTDGLDFL